MCEDQDVAVFPAGFYFSEVYVQVFEGSLVTKLNPSGAPSTLFGMHSRQCWETEAQRDRSPAST